MAIIIPGYKAEHPEKFDLLMKCERGQGELCCPPTEE
jgi:hypothetical protein